MKFQPHKFKDGKIVLCGATLCLSSDMILRVPDGYHIAPNLADERTAAPTEKPLTIAECVTFAQNAVQNPSNEAIAGLRADVKRIGDDLIALSANFNEFHALAEKRDKDVEGKLVAMDERIRSDDPTLTIPGDRMAIDSAPGTEVVFDARGGTDADKNKAEINLKRGRKYAVHSTKIASWYTEVWIKDSAGKITGPWNHCLFGKIVPAPSAPQSDESVDLDGIIDAASQEAFGPFVQPLSRWTDAEKKEARLIASRCYEAGVSAKAKRDAGAIAGMKPTEDHDDMKCPKCGEWSHRSRECDHCYGEGFHDDHDDDPINSPPGSAYSCPECNGVGLHHWCSKCGYHYTSADFERDAKENPPQPEPEERG